MSKALAVIGIIFGFILLYIGALAISGWIIMLVWGGLASAFNFQTIGYGTAILVSIALSIVGGAFRSVSSNSR